VAKRAGHRRRFGTGRERNAPPPTGRGETRAQAAGRSDVQRRVAGVQEEEEGAGDGRRRRRPPETRRTVRREVHDGQDRRVHKNRQRERAGNRPFLQDARAENGSSRVARAQRKRVPEFRGVLAENRAQAAVVRGERQDARAAVRAPRAGRAGGQVRAAGTTGAPQGRPAAAGALVFRPRHPRGQEPVRLRAGLGEGVPGESAPQEILAALQFPGETREIRARLLRQRRRVLLDRREEQDENRRGQNVGLDEAGGRPVGGGHAQDHGKSGFREREPRAQQRGQGKTRYGGDAVRFATGTGSGSRRSRFGAWCRGGRQVS